MFVVLALERVMTGNADPQVLVLAPTREIAVQIHETLRTVGRLLTAGCDFGQRLRTGYVHAQHKIRGDSFASLIFSLSFLPAG